MTGRYFEDGNEAPVIAERADGRSGVLTYALDDRDADVLWDETLRLLGR